MAEPPSEKQEQPSTYIVQDRNDQTELVRLALQDRLLTASLGGVLPEQTRLEDIKCIMDIGCGAGGWVIDTALSYPSMHLTGIDISQRMIAYAQQEAAAHQVTPRVNFLVMDALRHLDFPPGTFDLVNLRLGGSFLRTWDWPVLFSEIKRVTHPGSIIRIIEQEIMHDSNSPASTILNEMVLCAFYRAGHLFTPETTGLTAHLPGLMAQHLCSNVQSQVHHLNYASTTPEGQRYNENMLTATRTLRPFVQKRGCMQNNYDLLMQQSVKERQKKDFHATWTFHCFWGDRFIY